MAPADGGRPHVFAFRCAAEVHAAASRSGQAELRPMASHVQVLVRDALRARLSGRSVPTLADGSGERRATTLRWPPALRDEVQASADADGRSFNMQVETLIREALWSRGVRVGAIAPTTGREG